MQIKAKTAKSSHPSKSACDAPRQNIGRRRNKPLQQFTTLEDENVFSSTKTWIRLQIQKSDESERGIVESAAERLLLIEEERAIFLLVELSQYFECIGDPEHALVLLESCVSNSLRLGNLNLQRKVFNNIASAHARLCDFEKACLFYEKAHQLATCLDSPFFKFASLCNIVGLLQVMGLLSAAKDISLELAKFPAGTPDLDYLHIQNAINGFQLSRATKDYPSARIFDEIARAKIRTASPISITWEAYVSTNHAWCLCQDGQVNGAIEVVEDAILNSSRSKNRRVDVILICARANNAIAIGEEEKIEASKRELQSLLAKPKLLPLHREDLLRTLIDLYCSRPNVIEHKTGLSYLRQLTEHLINVSHRRFFSRISSAEDPKSSRSSTISLPHYNIPPAIAQDTRVLSGGRTQETVVIDLDRHVHELSFRQLSSGYQGFKDEIRTRSYCIAEDWAVAADFASEHGHLHCFMVGELARFIGLEFGFSHEDAVKLGLACRLHDIGKLALNETTHRAFNAGLMEDYCVIREHALAGARLLASSSDPLLQSAAVVAHSHHEWWNGRGSPEGLSATTIAIEARICAVADCYVSLLYPAGGRIRWEDEAAVRQVTSMFGIQLDPGLLKPFTRAVENRDLKLAVASGTFTADGIESGLYAAKRRLLMSTELAG